MNIDVGLVICDEGHRLKNGGAQITKALAMIKTERRVILSGTPIQNDLEEFYTMCMFVNPGVLGDISTFKQVLLSFFIFLWPFLTVRAGLHASY